jgi:hypothetical protein
VPALIELITNNSARAKFHCALHIADGPTVCGASSGNGHLLESVQHTGGIDQGGTRIDGCRNAERFNDLFPRGAMTRRGFGVHSDTAVAPDSDGDRERDQL